MNLRNFAIALIACAGLGACGAADDSNLAAGSGTPGTPKGAPSSGPAEWTLISVQNRCDGPNDDFCSGTVSVTSAGQVSGNLAPGSATLAEPSLAELNAAANSVVRTLSAGSGDSCTRVSELEESMTITLTPRATGAPVTVYRADRRADEICVRGDRTAVENLRAVVQRLISAPGTRPTPGSTGHP